MSRHEQRENKSAPEAAQTRVTAQEFAEAAAAVEARKAEEARRTQETIPIGEAVQELAVDATPEEILAQVQAIRAARAQSRPRGLHRFVSLFDRYRPRVDRTRGCWEPTGERFLDPTTGDLMEVYWNAETGERDYVRAHPR